MSKLFIGIDTSCYTTSICVADCNNNILLDDRIVLQVKKGKRGLRQSEAHFQHTGNLPELISDMTKKIDLGDVRAIAVSSIPRYAEGSYMPVFTAGVGFAKTIASMLDIDLYSFSHQEGHIRSGLYKQEDLLEKNEPFLCVHISGGTTEVLHVQPRDDRYHTRVVGGTLDISMGKLVDRLGVAMGLGFPCGKELDSLCIPGKLSREYKLPTSVKDGYFNLSGLETKLMQSMDSGTDKGLISLQLWDAITRTLAKSINNIVSLAKINNVLIVGGVASNSYLRDNLSNEINNTCKVIFSDKKLSTDNACGIALMCKDKKQNI